MHDLKSSVWAELSENSLCERFDRDWSLGLEHVLRVTSISEVLLPLEAE